MEYIRKGIDYDYHTDKAFPVPECPHCGLSLLGIKEKDIGKSHTCECGKDFFVPDEEWVRTYIRENNGTKKETAPCPNCGRTLIRTKILRNGKWRTFSARCEACGFLLIV